jgi:hypothetical protein
MVVETLMLSGRVPCVQIGQPTNCVSLIFDLIAKAIESAIQFLAKFFGKAQEDHSFRTVLHNGKELYVGPDGMAYLPNLYQAKFGEIAGA